MKKFVKPIGIVLLIVAISFCSFSCVQTESETKSTTNKHYAYGDIDTLPQFPTIEIETIDFDELTKEKTYMIKYTARLSYNNHVGNSWGYGLMYDDEYIENGCYIECNGMFKLCVTAYAFEKDEYNDYGSTDVTFDSLDIGEEQSKEVAVIVRENKGRYTGNTAQWIFVITAKRIT